MTMKKGPDIRAFVRTALKVVSESELRNAHLVGKAG
jgi:hypothetical protein